MRERLDCAVLLTQCTIDWVEPIMGQHAGGRLYLHALDPIVDVEGAGAHTALAASAMALRRYDACLLPVWPSSLSWARTSLSHASKRLHTPVIAIARELTTAGLHDLYQLGVADFLRDPFCSHEARIRIERLLDQRRGLHVEAATPHVADTGVEFYADDPVFKRMCENILRHDGQELEAYAVSAASRCSVSRESFKAAKSKVIERFERAYIIAALGRHGGNIAMAARAAQKHRRAFWALMRKHEIDAEPFRAQAQASLRDHRSECQASSTSSASGGRSAAYLGRFKAGKGGGGPFNGGGG